MIDGFSSQLLGAHVRRGAERGARARQGDRRPGSSLGLQHLRDPKVEHLDAAAFVRDHDVGWLQVAVDDAGVVRGFQRIRHLPADLDHLGSRDGAPRQPGSERLSLHQFQDEESDSTVLFDVVDGRDVGVIERREQLRFSLEPRNAFRNGGHSRWYDLDRDVAVEPGIPGTIHLTHAACTELPLNGVAALKGSVQASDDVGHGQGLGTLGSGSHV
jgi:hypothetical protein